MINEADLMQKMEMFIHMNHRARAMHGGCGPKHMPHGPYGPGCRQGGPRHMPMPGMPVPQMPRPMLGRERLLVLIGKSEGGVRQKDLLEKVHIGAPAMSELINKLEDDGYIVRTVDPADRRATLLSLTEKGAARAAEVEDERALRFKSAFAALSDEEKEALSAILDKLLLPRA
ncbi:MAG: MarR family transcriptional regulator [Lachnospiraceae bacterium]|nr:MarR family transcriptional regulator [Lachnospiraceae bacterium]